MATYTQQTGVQALEIQTGQEGAMVRIPCRESETDYFLMEEQLSSEVDRRPATNWIVDLSEHAEGVTLVLAGLLAGLGEKARRSGCTMKCVGLQRPSGGREAGCGVASFPAGCSGGKGWLKIAEEPSYLHW